MRSPADDDDEGKAPLAGSLEYQSSQPLMGNTVRGFESLAIVMMEVVSEIADSFRSGGKQSLVDRMQCVIEAKGPRVNKAVQHASADVMLWMHQGGFWRTLLVSVVGIISLIGVTGLTAFILVLLIATANVVAVGFLMSISAAGAFLALFFTSLTFIYVGALIAILFAVCTVAVLSTCAVLFVTGWIAFAWVVWQGVHKGLKTMKSTLSTTGNALSAVSNVGSTDMIAVQKRSVY